MSHFSDVMASNIDDNKKITHEQLGEQIESKLEDTKFWRKIELGDGVSFHLVTLVIILTATSSRLDLVIGVTRRSFNREGITISNLLLKLMINDSNLE